MERGPNKKHAKNTIDITKGSFSVYLGEKRTAVRKVTGRGMQSKKISSINVGLFVCLLSPTVYLIHFSPESRDPSISAFDVPAKSEVRPVEE